MIPRNTDFMWFYIKHYLRKKFLISYLWCNVYQRQVYSGEWTRPSHEEENSYWIFLHGIWYLTLPHQLINYCFLCGCFILGLITWENVQSFFILSNTSLDILFIRLTWNLLIRVEAKLHGAMWQLNFSVKLWVLRWHVSQEVQSCNIMITRVCFVIINWVGVCVCV